jgi:hypothetical protein
MIEGNCWGSPAPPSEFLAGPDVLVLDEVNIERVARLAELKVLKVSPVEVGLDLNVGAASRFVPPTGHDIPSGNECLVVRR